MPARKHPLKPASAQAAAGRAGVTPPAASELLAAVVTATDEAIFSCSLEGEVQSWNRGAQRLFGFSAQEVLGQPLCRFVLPGRQAECSELLGRIRQGQHIDSYDTRLAAKDGRRIDVCLTLSPIQSAPGQVSAVALVAHDMSRRVLAERALQESKEYLESIIDAAGDPIFVKDDRHRFVIVNQAYCRFRGRCREELVGHSPEGLLPPEQWEAIKAQDDRVLSSGLPECAEMPLDDATGHPHVVRIVKTRYEDKAGNRCVVGTFTDVTGQKAFEQQLKDVTKLKSDLISLINHEYANALTNMKLALALLKGSDPAPVEETRSHSYEVLDRAIENLRTYTTNFLNLHRLESGRFELNLQPIALHSVLAKTLSGLRSLAEAKRQKLDLQAEFPEGQAMAVRADPDCLCLILNNLVTNAVKYTPDEGRVTVRLSLEAGPQQQVRLAVEDTGIGMSAPELERIRGGFFRCPEGRELAKGFGVGLIIVQQLLAKHGVQLEIESQPGQGSKFSFRLPVI